MEILFVIIVMAVAYFAFELGNLLEEPYEGVW
jgi:hypothetical protein